MTVQRGEAGRPARDDDDAELVNMILAAGLGARSRWALKAAADAAGTEGIGGVLVIQIPPKGKDHCEMSFTIGTVEVTTKWG